MARRPADQARAQQQASLAQAQLDYQKQSDSQNLAFQREQATLQNQRYYSQGGNGSLTGQMAGGNGFGFDLGANDTAAMHNNYNNLWNGTNESTWGHSTYTGNGSAQLPTVSQSSQSGLGNAGSAAGSAAGSLGNGVSWSGNTQYSTMPVASFYTAPSMNGGSGFSSPSSMFNWS